MAACSFFYMVMINPTCEFYEQYGQTYVKEHFQLKILSLFHIWFKIHHGFFHDVVVSSK